MTSLKCKSEFKNSLQDLYQEEEIAVLFSIFEQEFGSTFLNETYKKVIDELLTGKPYQYILEKASFFDLEFEVTPSVLIPRPETEELVELMINTLSSLDSLHIIDIGTGSGCVACTLKQKMTKHTVMATDISKEALQLAQKNANRLHVNIQFLHDDVLDSKIDFTEIDVIVSNPPYIPILEKNKLDSTVKDFEPSLALFVPDDDPLLFYKAIASIAQKSNISYIFLETHQDYAQEVKNLFSSYFPTTQLKKDISGNDRFICVLPEV